MTARLKKRANTSPQTCGYPSKVHWAYVDPNAIIILYDYPFSTPLQNPFINEKKLSWCYLPPATGGGKITANCIQLPDITSLILVYQRDNHIIYVSQFWYVLLMIQNGCSSVLFPRLRRGNNTQPNWYFYVIKSSTYLGRIYIIISYN